jgi:hypothetical protein
VGTGIGDAGGDDVELLSGCDYGCFHSVAGAEIT